MHQLPRAILGLCLSAAATFAAEGFPRVSPTPPDKAEATFETLHGFRMELIAAEPLLVDPVDLAYDEGGRAYVVEMRDYPYPEEKNAAPTVFPGTVRLLEDANGDGKFDKATVFADHLSDVFFRTAKLDDAVVLSRNLAHLDLIGVIDELHRNRPNQIFERHSKIESSGTHG